MKTIRILSILGLLALAFACATPNSGPIAAAPPAKADLAHSAMSGLTKPEPVTHQLQAQARKHQSVGVQYLKDGKVALAIRELRAAEKLNPADKWIQLALGEAYRRRGLIEDCERHALTALLIEPEFQAARLTLSGLYIQSERYPEAIVYARLLVDDPTFPKPWLALTNQGFAEMRLGDRAAARETLELAVDYHDGYWRSILNLAILDSEEGKSLDAIQRFERVTQLAPGPLGMAEANYRIAEIYVGFGNRDQAIHHFAEAAATQYSGTWGKRSEDYLKRLR